MASLATPSLATPRRPRWNTSSSFVTRLTARHANCFTTGFMTPTGAGDFDETLSARCYHGGRGGNANDGRPVARHRYYSFTGWCFSACKGFVSYATRCSTMLIFITSLVFALFSPYHMITIAVAVVLAGLLSRLLERKKKRDAILHSIPQVIMAYYEFKRSTEAHSPRISRHP